METDTEFLTRAREMLAEEMEAAHTAIMATHAHSELEYERCAKREVWKLAAAMMTAQVGAVNALARLSPRRDGFTFTYMHQGTPPQRNLKTNNPLQSVLNKPEDVDPMVPR